ncbi:E3 ubiquitin-protein ligase RNF25 isoform X2 [Scyliorhinus torazame]|uniref:E3 ubiquitin-protein ligase RNF25 isoform X2 n=1 Tax=Scyliorhinus torazame TaxID=75743 RepID=UPI003B5A0080
MDHPAGQGEGAVCSEIEVLRSIYLDELDVSQDSSRLYPWEIRITLHPATADDAESQYVRFTLILSLTAQYPEVAPVVSIRNPRGLCDDWIQSIYQTLTELAEESTGGQVLYQLIEKGKDILTNNNIPHCQCVICLDSFQNDESFTKTSCYHYFHSYCLARYIRHSEAELRARQDQQQTSKHSEQQTELGVLCPVCREPLTYDLELLLSAAAPCQPLEPYQPDEASLRKRLELQDIFQRQLERGGIIDPEAERNRFFVSLTRPIRGQDAEDDPGGERDLASPSVTGSEPALAPFQSRPACAGPWRRGRPGARGLARPRNPRPPGEGAGPQEEPLPRDLGLDQQPRLPEAVPERGDPGAPRQDSPPPPPPPPPPRPRARGSSGRGSEFRGRPRGGWRSRGRPGRGSSRGQGSGARCGWGAASDAPVFRAHQ